MPAAVHDGPGGEVTHAGMQRARTARPARRARAKPLPYPELPDHHTVSSAVFWRAAWLRDVAELNALRRHTMTKAVLAASDPLRYALAGAESQAERDVTRCFENLVRCGGLPFAWVPE
jgi:hypothetical protein